MKARYLLIRTFGFLMSALLVINFMIPSNATSENKDERVLLFLDGLNEISISQPVRIIVYESTESYSDNDYYVYNEEMVLELFVEGHNYVAFTRPSKFFSTAVDLNTLPYGFGITEQTHFFTTNDTEYVFRVERIQEVKLQKDGDEYYPVFLSEKGEELVSNYSISTRVISYKDNNDQSQIEITKEISLSYGGLSRLFTVLESISYANECEKNGLLYEYGFMAEDEYVQWIAETVLDGRLEVFNQDGTELYWTLYNFVSDNNCVTSAMEDALCKLSGQTRYSLNSYVVSNSGKFRVFYDCSEPSISSSIATAVANEFDGIDNLFCTNWGFLRPYYTSLSSYYTINLIPEGVNTPLVGTYGSYINIDYTTAIKLYNHQGANGFEGLTEMHKGVLAHEYMHAIFYRYAIKYNTNDRKWMHESFANWAGIAYEADYAGFCQPFVRKFLSTTHLPLNQLGSGSYEGRHYGACVFPMYIQQQMGGYTTIKKILESYSSSLDPLTAINAGLQYYGYSLASAYAGCASYNYDTGYFYTAAPSTGSYTWGGGKITKIETYPNSPSTQFGVNGLACHYTQFNAPVNTNSTLTISVDYLNCTGDAVPVLKSIRKTASGDCYISTHSITSGHCTIVMYNFGSSSSKSMTLIPINTGLSGMTYYNRPASVVYAPSNNTVYRLRNIGSGKYLNVHYGIDANTTNVYQWTADGSVEQNFRLELLGNGIYYIRAMCSSNGNNRVLDIVKSGGAVVSGCNVEIYAPVDPIAQEWMFFSMGNGQYRVVPASNTSVALTSYGTSNGTSGGQSPTSAGNVFVSTFTGSSNQLWTFDPLS